MKWGKLIGPNTRTCSAEVTARRTLRLVKAREAKRQKRNESNNNNGAAAGRGNSASL